MWFLNPALLFALAGVSLPVLAHLLSKKKYEVVRWGAMQFLQLGRQTQRRVQLEEWLLMLLRMGVIALLVFGLSRPWISSAWLAQYSAGRNRDVVFILDGSTSMNWEGAPRTPEAEARQWLVKSLEVLKPGDQVTVLESRDTVRPVVQPATSDFRVIRKAIDELPPPGGTADLPEAISQALRQLSRGQHLVREVIVLTDLQALSWHAEDTTRWEFIDEQLKQPHIVPRLWVVDTTAALGVSERENFSLDQLQATRRFTVPGLPVRVRTRLRHYGGQVPAAKEVHLEIDGQRLAQATVRSPALPAGGEFPIEFEHQFARPGFYRMSAAIDRDTLLGDNQADTVIEVLPSLPVLVVDGAPHLDDTRSETFFFKAALQAAGDADPLVQARVIPVEALTSDQLTDQRVLVLANVPRLTDAQLQAVQAFVDTGGGLWLALGDRVDTDYYNAMLGANGRGLLPVTLSKVETVPPPAAGADPMTATTVSIDNRSLELPWLAPFRREERATLTDARFDHWWGATPVAGQGTEIAAAVRWANLSNGQPWLVARSFGRGQVLVSTTPLDADWSTLPTKPDYVPWVHECLFQLASAGQMSRHVQVGEPLIIPIAAGSQPQQYVFRGPGTLVLPAEAAGDELQPLARLSDTSVPGMYELIPASQKGARVQGEPGYVDFNRSEGDLTPLTEDEQKQLAGEGRLRFIKSLAELRKGMFADESRTEFWPLMMFILLVSLVVEVWLTRRLVQGGHAQDLLEDHTD